MIKKVILAFYRSIIGICTLLVGVLVVICSLAWDNIKFYILRKPKIEHPDFDQIVEKEFVHSKKENVSQPSSTPVSKEE